MAGMHTRGGVTETFRPRDPQQTEEFAPGRQDSFRLLFDTTPDACFLVDDAGVVCEVNVAACILCGDTRANLTGRNLRREILRDRFLDASTPGTAIMVGEKFPQAGRWAQGSGTAAAELYTHRVEHEGRQLHLIQLRVTPTESSAHEDLLWKAGVLRVVNAAAVELTASELPDLDRRLHEQLMSIPGAVWAVFLRYDSSTRFLVTQGSSGARGMMSAVNRLIGRHIDGVRYPVNPAYYEHMVSQQVSMFEGTYDLMLGSLPRPICKGIDHILGVGHAYVMVLSDQRDLLGTVALLMSDRSPVVPVEALISYATIATAALKRQAAESRATAHARDLRRLATRLSLTEARERRELASALHDDVVQTLAAAQIGMSTLAQDDQVPPASRSTASAAASWVDQSIRRLRTMTFELSPPVLYDFGLRVALEWLAERTTAERGIACACKADPEAPEVPVALRVSLFQMTRELVQNAIKHASASRIEIRLQPESGGVQIQVEDNGVGLRWDRPVSPNLHGFGLFSIRERLRDLGGELALAAASPRGTRATLAVPARVVAEYKSYESQAAERHSGG